MKRWVTCFLAKVFNADRECQYEANNINVLMYMEGGTLRSARAGMF